MIHVPRYPLILHAHHHRKRIVLLESDRLVDLARHLIIVDSLLDGIQIHCFLKRLTVDLIKIGRPSDAQDDGMTRILPQTGRTQILYGKPAR